MSVSRPVKNPSEIPKSAKKIEINGVVQGVGFRPFLFVLAKKHKLTGHVSNTEDGVSLVIQGRPDAIENFISDIPEKKPILSSISTLKASDTEPADFNSFKILKSKGVQTRSTLISPDVTVCRDCLAELHNPGDRRFEYPFINCTNCGPRYTIIEDIPYDRAKTSMKEFTMCAVCQKEYEDPLNRRFHAQPNACPVCGPHVFLTDNNGNAIEKDPKSALDLAARYLSEGKIVGIKGLGGFHLACDATHAEAVNHLRDQKNRPHKPFALMAVSVDSLKGHVRIDDIEKQLLESYHSPIVLLEKREDPETGIDPIAEPVAPINNYLGCMLPSTPLHHLILNKGPDILVMTSGNRSGEPLSIDNEDAIDAFSHIADYFLLHNRDIFFGADDSVTRVLLKKNRFIRRSRGYAPLPVHLAKPMPPILGCGAGLKNTICLTRDHHAFLSPHIGDLDNVKVYQYFQRNIEHLKQILDIKPMIIAHDMHPGYMSTQYAQEQEGVKKIAVQHHHSHAAACMAENRLENQVAAITLDGTGLGTDGHIWGGEILVCDKRHFTRKAHLAYIPMPGGDAAVKEPWRMAISLLYQAFGEDIADLSLPFLDAIVPEHLSFICQMIDKNLNSPLTSSTGRLFDAVAALLNIRYAISYESQAAMELEAIAKDTCGRSYDFHLLAPGLNQNTDETTNEENTCYEIDILPAIGQIVEDIGQNKQMDWISACFHDTLVTAFSRTAQKICKDAGINDIVLSGGVFNNKRIFTQMVDTLESKGFNVYTHSILPTGDGGISLGQAVVAAALEEQ